MEGSRYTTLDAIVKSAIIDTGDITEHVYSRFLHWAFEATKQFHFDVAREVRTVLLEMSDAKTVDLPIDYIDYAKIGVLRGDRIKTYLVNDRIEIFDDRDSCGHELAKPTAGNIDRFLGTGSFFFRNYFGQNIYSYGSTCYSIGYCRIDKARSQIVFSSEADKSEVYLEYITNGINPTGESSVHEYAEMTIKYYILWKKKESSMKFGANEKERARMLYYNERRICRARLSSFNVEDFMAANRRGYLDSLEEGKFNRPATPVVTETADDCKDEYPAQLTIESRPFDDYFITYFGAKSNPNINDSELIKSLTQEWQNDKLNIDVQIVADDEYIYVAYPFAWGAATNIEIDTNPEAFSFSQESITDITGTQDYYIYRSDAKWTGDFQVQVT